MVDEQKNKITATSEWESAARRVVRQRRQLFQVGVLLFCPLLLHSCSLSEITLSLGPAAPIVVIEVSSDDFWPQRVQSFSAVGLVMNVAFAVALIYAAAIPRAREVMLSKSFRYSLLVFLFLSNCVLACRFLPFLAHVWHYGVLHEWMLFMQVIRPAMEQISLLMRRPGEPSPFDVEIVASTISSRMYFATFLICGAASPRLLRWFHRYVLQPSPDRWWQISLRGWFALTLVISLATSLIVWIVRNS